MKTLSQLREALEIGTKEIVAAYKKATPGEAVEPPSPDEGSMALRQLNFMAEAIEEIMEHIEEGGDFPEWMQNKLTEAHTKVKDLYASIEGSEDDEDEDEEDDDEDMNEAVEVSHDRYMRSHGKKAKGGHGMWMFTHKRMGDVDHKDMFHVSGKFADAAKAAKAWAKKNGHSTVYVMESAEQISERIYADDYKAGYEKSNFGGYRPHVTHKKTGKTMYLGQASYKKPEHAKGHADAYLKGYEAAGDNYANRKSMEYQKANAKHLYVKESIEEAKKYTPPTKAEIEADKKKDQKGKPRPSMSAKSVNKNLYKNMMEKLTVADGMAKWIKDFQASDAPQFKGQDKEERKEMAIAAYLAAKRKEKGTNESDANWAKSMEKQKFDRLSKKDQEALMKLRDLMAKEKGKKK